MSSKVKYNYDLLKLFCQENQLNIVDNLNNSDIGCNTIIEDKCINKNCNNYFNKKFHILYKTKIFTCKKCTIENSKLKIKETITEKYGVEYVGQINEVKEKKKNTCLNKYGVENVLQNKDIIDKIKETNNLKYIEKNGKPMPSTITIDEKNKLLFGYISTEDAVTKFEQIKGDIASSSELIEIYYREYNNVFDNEEKKSELKQLLSSSYLFINQIKDAVKNYEKTHNTQYCKDAVTMYVEQLKPMLTKIMNLKYNASFVDYDSKTGIYSLIQQKYTIKNTESMNDEPKVITYEKGVPVVPQNKSKKVRDEPTVKKNVTKKKKLLIAEDSDSEIEEGDNEGVNGEEEEDQFTGYVPNSPVYQPNSPEYQNISPGDSNEQLQADESDFEDEEP